MFNLLIIFFAKYLVYLLVALSLIYFFLQNKTLKKKIVWLVAFTLPTAFVIAKILSHFYYDTRPFVAGHFIPLISHAADNGFPSDHALLSFSLAFVVFVFNKKWGTTFFLMGIIIGASRIYSGIHSPIDIIGSFLISAVVSLLYCLVLKKFKKLD
jgi:undecaprenyl-diphosphatase